MTHTRPGATRSSGGAEQRTGGGQTRQDPAAVQSSPDGISAFEAHRQALVRLEELQAETPQNLGAIALADTEMRRTYMLMLAERENHQS